MNIDLGSLWTAAGVLIGFQVTAFIWRMSREAEEGEKKRVTWLPPADMVNLLSLVVTTIGIFIVPTLGFGSVASVKEAFGLSVLLLTGYPFAVAGHYDLFNRSTGRSLPTYLPGENRGRCIDCRHCHLSDLGGCGVMPPHHRPSLRELEGPVIGPAVIGCQPCLAPCPEEGRLKGAVELRKRLQAGPHPARR